MEHEVRGLLQGQPGSDRVEEWHDPEPAGEDQPEATEFPDPELDRPGGAPAYFSNYGQWVDACAPTVDAVAAFLRFEDVTLESDPLRGPQTFEGYAVWSGTSFAAPQFAGMVAKHVVRDKVSAQEAAANLLAGAIRRVPRLGVEFEL